MRSQIFTICMSGSSTSGAGFLVIDVWELPEAFARFGEVLGQVNLQPTPDIRQIHRIIARERAGTTG
jgi:hypothetical protein